MFPPNLTTGLKSSSHNQIEINISLRQFKDIKILINAHYAPILFSKCGLHHFSTDPFNCHSHVYNYLDMAHKLLLRSPGTIYYCLLTLLETKTYC